MLGKDGLARGIKKLRTRSFTQTVGVAQKKVITPEDFNNMFVVKDREKRTAWHISARKGQK